MPSLRVPTRLRELLVGTGSEGPIFTFAADVALLLEDNKVEFFPAYTDHGMAHAESVLQTSTRLVPDHAWAQELLTEADAAALVSACLLHDLGLHVRAKGFIELVAPGTRFRPLPWFDLQQGARKADLPWHEEWERFRAEARHFTVTQMNQLLGSRNDGLPAVADADNELNPDTWTDNDRLLIGEFLRRNHARLGHEIAVYGFPGAPTSIFRPLTEVVGDLGDIAGAIARSHNELLRTMGAYFKDESAGDLRPAGVCAHYLMALLRIADYLQLDASRAPVLLLHLKAPQSPVSTDEWNKHNAISSISWNHKDLQALFVRVSAKHGIRMHLQLRELFDDLQRELDTATAFLSEIYSGGPLSPLRLARQRVYTNLDDPLLHRRLSYVPRRAALRSSEDLFRLVVKDLYGNEPVVAARELLQNAVDAVRERIRWTEVHGQPPTPFYDLDADVVVELRETTDSEFELRVTDRGIGMTPDTVIDYFLAAGASLRSDFDFPSEAEASRRPSLKAGRFGIGAYAGFLLGPGMSVTTRHIRAERGVQFTARIDEDLVELKWADDVPIGTDVRIRGAIDALPDVPGYAFPEEPARYLIKATATYYQSMLPTASFRVVRADGEKVSFEAPRSVPSPDGPLPPDWRRVPVEDITAVLWSLPLHPEEHVLHRQTFSYQGVLVHNGIAISRPSTGLAFNGVYNFKDEQAQLLIAAPPVAVFDPLHRIGVTLTRYSLTERHLPFEEDLLESIGRDVAAHALVNGPNRHPLSGSLGLRPVFAENDWFPFLPAFFRAADELWVLWEEDATWGGDAVRAHDLNPPFAGDLDSCTWDEAPLRMSLRIAAPGGDTAASWDFALRQVVYSGFQLATAEVICRRPGTQSGDKIDAKGRPGDAHDPTSAPFGWTRSSLDEAGTTFSFHDTSHPRSAMLRRVGREILRLSSASSVLLGVFRYGSVADEDAAKDHPLTRSWRATIGGMLERDDAARTRRTKGILSRDATLADYASSWSHCIGDGDVGPPSS